VKIKYNEQEVSERMRKADKNKERQRMTPQGAFLWAQLRFVCAGQ